MNIPVFSFSQSVRSNIPGIKLGVLKAESVFIDKNSDLADRYLAELEIYLKHKFSQNHPSGDTTVSAVRRMYRRIGWEPTQYRPSSEALIRRILKEKGIYRIYNIVDLANISSARFAIPLGLYDLDKITGDIMIDVGKKGETYQGISKDLIHAEGKMVLRDKAGIFGNPTSDSRRTCLSSKSKNIIAIFFTPPEINDTYLRATLKYLHDLIAEECENSIIATKIIKDR